MNSKSMTSSLATADSLSACAPDLAVVDGKVTTSSLQVAEHFGKAHKSVLRAIRNLECSPEYHQRNFAPMVFEIEIGSGAIRKDPAYRLTRDGFVFLAMGFTGKEAAQWKEAYIETFNRMEAELMAARSQRLKKRAEKALLNRLEPVPQYRPLEPGKLIVDRAKLVAIWVDLGKLRSRLDGLGVMESDLPPLWWQQNAISQ